MGQGLKWSNPGKGVAPFTTPHEIAIGKKAFESLSTTVTHFTKKNSNDAILTYNWVDKGV